MLQLKIDYEEKLKSAWKNQFIGDSYILKELRRALPARIKELRQMIAKGEAVITE
jgi:hypothetical protein